MSQNINKIELLRFINSLKTEVNPATNSEEVGRLTTLTSIEEYINNIEVNDFESQSSEVNEFINLVQLIEIRYNADITISGLNTLTYLGTIYGIKELYQACHKAFDKYDKDEFWEKIGTILFMRKKYSIPPYKK